MKNLPEIILVVVIGLLGGAMVGLQGPMSGAISQRVGAVGSSFIIHVVGAIASGIALVVVGGGSLRDWSSIPRPYWFAGVFGLILYLTLSYTLPRVGAVTAAALLIAAQLVVGLIIDHMGWLGVNPTPVNPVRLLGVGLLLVGAYLTTR